ncbi:Right handed beta helix region [Halogranum rubrum]|uniref:Right handed beta helix region n=1 Tax=Halogranum rubrum TaxID=553466 RepID=A0A1I4EQ10_9EURY|nr:right-handed parallel beta-helix repeat-containing protein [Halogranum rubrum]SFL07835.1 Right handed beta helix region [Halogranum rubrum]
MNNLEKPDDSNPTTWSRRSFLGTAAAGSLLGATKQGTGTVEGKKGSSDLPSTADQVQESRATTALQIGPELNLGERRVVASGEYGYDTIQDAWEHAASGDIIFVHGSYDAQEAGEEFPIVLDQSQKEVVLTGGHPSGSVIDARHAPDKNVIEVLGRGQNDYRNKAIVQKLKIRGGNIGLRIRAAPYSTYKDLVFFQTGSHGVSVETYNDASGAFKGSFGINFRSCVAWSCRGVGFRLSSEARPHSTSFYGCHALWNGYYEGNNAPGVLLRGYASRWNGGTIQNNGSYGIDARGGGSQTVYGTYFEGNGASSEFPHGIYVSKSPGLSIDSCYFNGHFSREVTNGLRDGHRAIAVVDAKGVDIRNTTFRNYTDAFLYGRNTLDVDIHRPSHDALDETEFLSDASEFQRLRSDGMVQEADLRDTDGLYRGDMGIHNGDGEALWGPAVWNGREWISVMEPTIV